uniref:Uncharacterized protein n=1 Tax=Sphaerodactylus townsendi TaxID=933632 RepID=A0ACB8GB17_9SAUR
MSARGRIVASESPGKPSDLESPEGLALDHLGRTIFWTDSQLDRIEVAKLDGSQRRVLFDTDLVNPRSHCSRSYERKSLLDRLEQRGS